MARTSGSHSEITGPKILQEAQALFARHGYAAVSMRQIAQAVGVQAGALYNYTPDKQSLLFGLMQSHMQDLTATWATQPQTGSAMERLKRFAEFHISFHHARRDAVFIAYMELRNLTPENFSTIEALRRRYEDELERILKDGVASGAFGVADTKITAMALIAMLTGVNTWFRETGRLSLAEVQAIYWDMARKAVAA
ncbi:TetR/AcrR family transcriptional regulator [Cognatishimia sp. SS12]|uniref:TetR/AcrR family transcriptional regulator n=1 Tax=Cognatishimia sp. SS12 TaxID=2979465 RepID=UPI00232C95CE|nr:TetR/AcrR family transcriptional regulator [Cognatishimia sp. SS12]MDC0736698.1 TetR/AcrR family transcriptional regulator [Cognatishimia sp. SS12]